MPEPETNLLKPPMEFMTRERFLQRAIQSKNLTQVLCIGPSREKPASHFRCKVCEQLSNLGTLVREMKSCISIETNIFLLNNDFSVKYDFPAARMSVGKYSLLVSSGCAFYNSCILFHFHYTCRKYGLNSL